MLPSSKLLVLVTMTATTILTAVGLVHLPSCLKGMTMQPWPDGMNRKPPLFVNAQRRCAPWSKKFVITMQKDSMWTRSHE